MKAKTGCGCYSCLLFPPMDSVGIGGTFKADATAVVEVRRGLQLFAVPTDGLSRHRLDVESGCYSCC